MLLSQFLVGYVVYNFFCLKNESLFFLNAYTSIGEGTIEYEILEILPFDSTRKRMSVVLRRPETRQIVVYCKGADSAILPRLAYTRKPPPPFQLLSCTSLVVH